jgi:hypothetical protein
MLVFLVISRLLSKLSISILSEAPFSNDDGGGGIGPVKLWGVKVVVVVSV